MNVNSKSYWDSRFDTDWIEYSGDEQSKFFASILLNALNKPLLSFMSCENITIVDWGCALGDGTSIFHQHINKNISGIDFSESAINQATKKYPEITFKCENWLSNEEEISDGYKVLISSNTLEHFDEPYSVLSSISKKVENMMILAIPYEEYDRIEEHSFTFENNNIPYIFDNEWVLSYTKIIDCNKLNPTYWNGKQIVLVYSKIEWLKSQPFNVDFFYDINEAPYLKGRLDELSNENMVSEKLDLILENKNHYQLERDNLINNHLEVLKNNIEVLEKILKK